MDLHQNSAIWRVIRVLGFVLFFLNIAFGLLAGQPYFPSWLFPMSLGLTLAAFIAFLGLALRKPPGVTRPFLFSVFKGYIVSLAMVALVWALQLVVAIPQLLFGGS